VVIGGNDTKNPIKTTPFFNPKWDFCPLLNKGVGKEALFYENSSHSCDKPPHYQNNSILL
jgi:hypothetical protein